MRAHASVTIICSNIVRIVLHSDDAVLVSHNCGLINYLYYIFCFVILCSPGLA
jgi:hypothetical protein